MLLRSNRMKELLNKLGISQVGEYAEDGSYVIDIDNSNKWGVVYSKLDNSPLVELQDESSLLTADEASLIYFSDSYQLTLIADFDNEIYKLVVSEVK